MGTDKQQAKYDQNPYYCNNNCNCFNRCLKKRNIVRAVRVITGFDFTAIFISLR